MMRKRLPLLVLLLCAAGFAFGLFRLFELRFEAGDVYPPYSSLRSDPLGTMALFESLERIPGLSVRRDFSAGNQLPEDRQTVYLHLAAQTGEWEWAPEELVREVERFVTRGGRLAITFFPETTKPSGFYAGRVRGGWPPATNNPSGGNKSSPSKATKKSANTNARPQGSIWLKKRLGVEFGFVALEPGEGESYRPARVVNQTGLPLPGELDWHSGMIFTNLDEAWRTVYARGANPVVVERKLGSGTIVMATDSYFLSNEAMLKDRHADLLAWVVGAGNQVVFDEAHLGVVSAPGVAELMRKYRLYALAVGLALLAGLFIWKNASSLVPPYPEEARPEYAAGRDASAGFVNLLRRNIAPREVLGVCFAEWTKSLLHGDAHAIARVDQAQTIIEAENARPERARDPVRAYREICRALKGKGNL